MSMTTILFIVGLAISSFYYGINAIYFMHMLQNNSYMPLRYTRWIKKNPFKAFKIVQIIPLIITLILSPMMAKEVVLIIFSLTYIGLILFREKVRVKKKLVYTSRVKRTLIFHSVLYMIVVLSFFLTDSVLIRLTLLNLLNILSAVMALLAITILIPFESMVKRHYYNDAKRRLHSHKSLTVVGITGSYGKTSTKHIVESILSRKFNVLMTQGSYNTTMGVVITVRGRLNTMTEIFIAEMGAKEVGDIKAICNLVEPDVGILTSIGPQHLETFKTIDRIIDTKFELIDALDEGGIAILNDDNAYIQQYKEKHIKTGVSALSYGASSGKDITATEIKLTRRGMTFVVIYEGKSYDFETKLLGYHNINNILSGVLLGFKMGMTYEEVYMGVRSIETVEHRLELSRRGIYTLIDDAYNSNPEGAKMAIDVLKAIDGNHKIIITPGMIELGDVEYDANYNFGKQMAEVCDYVILVGKKQTAPIQKGLEDQQYPSEKCTIVTDIFEAYAHLNKIVSSDDVVLIENDLPDDYNE